MVLHLSLPSSSSLLGKWPPLISLRMPPGAPPANGTTSPPLPAQTESLPRVTTPHRVQARQQQQEGLLRRWFPVGLLWGGFQRLQQEAGDPRPLCLGRPQQQTSGRSSLSGAPGGRAPSFDHPSRARSTKLACHPRPPLPIYLGPGTCRHRTQPHPWNPHRPLLPARRQT